MATELNLSVISILSNLLIGKLPNAEEVKLLEARELADKERAKALGINSENVTEIIAEKVHLFLSLKEDIDKLPFSSKNLLEILWIFWLPLGIQLVKKRQKLNRALIQGILGLQGTGKTTLANILIIIIEKIGYHTISISLDDLYKTYGDRLLLKQQDPRLIWRGPPGTHDVELGRKILERLRHSSAENSPAESIDIPRFDKSLFGGAGDRIKPEIVSNVDIVLFEGWCVGARPIDSANFEVARAPIITEVDKQFARDMNYKLQDYLPLWEMLDSLIVLYPSDYRFSKKWRLQAERERIAGGKSGMSDEEIDRFVEYFWKALHPELFIKPLIHNSEWVDLAVEVESDRSIGRIFSP